jgi:DUF971 family protein
MSSTGATDPAEIAVSREKRQVRIRWRDGHDSVYTFDLLRAECPCALCNDRRNTQSASASPGLAVLSGPVIRPGEIQATAAKPVGRYAINFVWSDGHDSGIYSYTYLRGMCPCGTCHGHG